MTWRMRISIGCLLGVLAVGGCAERGPEQRSPLVQDSTEYLLAVVVDMSGSYAHLMTEGQGKAYRFFMRLINDFFRQRIGANDRIVISQLSRTQNALLWDGSPLALQKDFPSEKAFNRFLLAHSDPAGSPVHTAIADTVDYVLGYPGVRNGRTKSAVFVLSDMDDNAPDTEDTKKRLLTSLETYAKTGGVVGLYWVEGRYVVPWRQHLKDCGLRDFVVESDIVSLPRVPQFE